MKIRAFFISVLLIPAATLTAYYAAARQETSSGFSIPKDKSPSEVIQTLVQKMHDELEKDVDKFPDLIQETTEYTQQVQDSATASLLHSLLAEMYQSYYNQNGWTIHQRTPLQGYVPEDIREWTANLFEEKIKEELKQSLSPIQTLQNTPAEKYAQVMELGKDARTLRPTLYDFLLQRAIDIQADDAYYQTWLQFRKTQANPKAETLVALDYLQYQYRKGEKTRSTYKQSLDSLLTHTTDPESQLEIQLNHLDWLQQEPYYYQNNAQQDSVRQIVYDFCQQQARAFAAYPRANEFKNAIERMEQASISIQHKNQVYPGKEQELKIRYKHVTELRVKVYQNKAATVTALRQGSKDNTAYYGKLVKEMTVRLPQVSPLLTKDTTLLIPMEQPGLFMYEVSTTDKSLTNRAPFSVSRLALTYRPNAEGIQEVFVTDFETGKPLADIPVICYNTTMQWEVKELATVKTDAKGFALLAVKNRNQIDAVHPVLPQDTAALLTGISASYRQMTGNKSQTYVSLFTDRGIYRPGQTVAFKGIVYTDDKKQLTANEGETISVSLRDANYKEIARKEFTTNAFGSFHGEFTLPQQGLNGNFTLVTDKASASFRVEEYKRPSFRLDIEPIKEEVSFGNEVQIQGKAESFSGVALQEGKVEWTITRRPFWLRAYMPNPYNQSYEQVAQGTADVNQKGQFQFTFVPEREQTDSDRPVCQSYEVKARLTDSKGETQETSYVFSVGDAGIVLSLQLNYWQEKEKAEAKVIAQTLNGEKVKAQGSYTLYKLTEKKESSTGSITYETDSILAVGPFSTDQTLTDAFKNLASGRYRLQVNSMDQKGVKVKAEGDFILYSLQDRHMPVFISSWMPNGSYEALPGETIDVYFGTSESPAYVIYELFAANGTRIHRELVSMRNENRAFPVLYQESYGEGMTASFSFVKGGKLYSNSCSIVRKEPERKLTFHTETFRDHLLPGSQENWKFRLIDADSSAVQAEVLASMYDASLDQILPFHWYFTPQRHVSLWRSYFQTGLSFQTQNRSQYAELSLQDVPAYSYDQMYQAWTEMLQQKLRFYAASSTRSLTGGLKLRGTMAKSAANASEVLQITEDSAVLSEPEVSSANAVMAEEAIAAPAPAQTETVSFRENFAETAFFYPVLQTDETGHVSFNFTVPESNTTWKLQLLAQTQNMKYGYLSKEAVTSKPIMVSPYLPRFLRNGDEAVISTQIINQMAETIQGKAKLELFNPETEEILLQVEKPFSLTADETGTIQWNFLVKDWDKLGVVGCRIQAVSAAGSDGEQHLLPVLPNQTLITESIPFYLTDEKELAIKLPKQALTNPYRITFEVSSNPIWYAVQALSTLNEPKQEDILSWFSVYYSNTLSAYIAQAHPRIKQVIDQWKAARENAGTLLSNLEKNEELKTILLEETPWMLDAANETEQKQRLQLLFDTNRTAQVREEALQQLLKQQLPNGGWSWMKGMPASRHITLQILKGMAQLIQLNAVSYNQAEKEMQMKALRFLDQSIQEDYEQLLKIKGEPTAIPSDEQVEYLFVRSFYRDIPELGEAREAIRYYTRQAETNWKEYGLYSRAAIAWLMYQNGKKETTQDIVAWFRKTATDHAEKGMYWANNRNTFASNRSAIETHCLIMALFQQTDPNQEQTDRMKQWLLNQKRTQNWESVPATQNAIYALLLTGNSWIEETNVCHIRLNDATWSTTDGETGTGYLKVNPTITQLTSVKSPVVRIQKSGKAPAWGSIYIQYFAPLEEVEKQKGVLNVEKKLFVETNESGKREIRPVTEEQPLKVGDKVIVRLTVRSDRDMEYVFLKDLRAGCFEPTQVLSGSQYRDGIWYYRSSKDLSENIYIEHLPQGTFVLEYPVVVSRSGSYTGGISTIQCLYAPEFISHTEGNRLLVTE